MSPSSNSSPKSLHSETTMGPSASPLLTGEIWATLASIATAAFNEAVIGNLHQFICETPQFSMHHLHMLGPIVVRHVSMQLSNIRQSSQIPNTCFQSHPHRSFGVPGHSNRSSSSPSPSCHQSRSSLRTTEACPHSPSSLAHCSAGAQQSLSNSPVRMPPQRPQSQQPYSTTSSNGCDPPQPAFSRSSFYCQDSISAPSLRDVAYQAVRLRKIVPLTQFSEDTCSLPTFPTVTSRYIRKSTVGSSAPTSPPHATPNHRDQNVSLQNHNKHLSELEAITFRPALSPCTMNIPATFQTPMPRQCQHSPPEPQLIHDETCHQASSNALNSSRVSAVTMDAGECVDAEFDNRFSHGKALSPMEGNRHGFDCTQYDPTHPWKIKSGIPDVRRFPRAGADANLASADANVFRCQQYVEGWDTLLTVTPSNRRFLPSISSKSLLHCCLREQHRPFFR